VAQRLIFTLALALGLPSRARACYSAAEATVAWDAQADVYVRARWPGRTLPPGRGVLAAEYDLARLSTGEELATASCPEERGCDWRQALAAKLPADARWTAPGTGSTARLRIRLLPDGRETRVTLEARTPAGWRRLLWIDQLPESLERRKYKVTALELKPDVALIAYHGVARGGNCAYTESRAVRLPARDLDEPQTPAQRARLLTRLTDSSRFELWWTAAELGPIPAEKLVAALVAAERAGRYLFGARWWKETTPGLKPEQLEVLKREVKARKDLDLTRTALGL
jgi:hypothetical protein